MVSLIMSAARCLLGLMLVFIESGTAISTCLSVVVAGAEGSLSGIYNYDGSSSYKRPGGSTSYILGKYTNDQWRLGQGLSLYYALSNYPHYYTYDASGHPVDVVEAWQLVASADNEEEAPSSFSITCAVNPTPSPTSLTPAPTPSPTSLITPPPTLSGVPPTSSFSTSQDPTLGTPSTPTPPRSDSTPLTPTASSPGVPSSTPVPVGPTPPVSGRISCTIDIPCPDDKCCNPDTNQCGRTPDYCHERGDKKVCCSYASQDLSTTESCFEDDVCDGRRWYETAWWALLSLIIMAPLEWCRRTFCRKQAQEESRHQNL